MTDLSIQFSFPTLLGIPPWLITAFCCASLLAVWWAVWQRIGKTAKVHFAVVAVLNGLAFFAVVGLLGGVEVRSADTAEVILVTGALASEQRPASTGDVPVYGLHQNTAAADLGTDALTLLERPSDVFDLHPHLHQLRVVGDGLTEQQWLDLEYNLTLMGAKWPAVSFSPAAALMGFVDLVWPRQSVLGETLDLTGTLQGADRPTSNAASEEIFDLLLLDPNEEVVARDRVKFSDNFVMGFVPKANGRWHYRLQLQRQGEILLDEIVAVNVVSPPVPRVLVKQSAPSFETRQMHNWLSQFGTPVAVLTQISQDVSSLQSINIAEQERALVAKLRRDPMTLEQLRLFDLLVMDGRGALTLTDSEKSSVKQAVEQGLGVVILADSDLLAASTDGTQGSPLDWLTRITVTPLAQSQTKAYLQWPGNRPDEPVVIVSGSLDSRAPSSVSTLVGSDSGADIAMAESIGLGAVAVSLFNTSYQWQTSGRGELYSHFWQRLVKGLSRNTKASRWLDAGPSALLSAGLHHQRCALVAEEVSATQGTGAGLISLQLLPSLLDDSRHCAPVWLAQGWQTLSLLNGDDHELDRWDVYGYESSDWRAWQQQLRQIATLKRVSEPGPSAPVEVYKPVKKALLWWLLMVCLAALWVERKFIGQRLG